MGHAQGGSLSRESRCLRAWGNPPASAFLSTRILRDCLGVDEKFRMNGIQRERRARHAIPSAAAKPIKEHVAGSGTAGESL
jgi:hypothetical protein